MLRIEGQWLWDSWVADDGQHHHLFFLKAPAQGDAAERHTNARVGHARSRDLVAWEVLPDALAPDPDGWDDLAIWTGSVARGDDGVWRMYYTAISTRGGHLLRDQRIGMVESADLTRWQRVTDRPVLEVDPRWYKSLPQDPSASETWRDPLVLRDPGGDGWHMLLTARGLGAGQHDDGVLGHARSADMRTWEAGPPLSTIGAGFGELEVPQVRGIGGRCVLVFTCHPRQQTGARRRQWGEFCTWYVVGDSVLGPWDLTAARPFADEPDLFAAPLVPRRDGSWAFLGFRNLESKGTAAFEILDPIPVRLENDRLVRDRPSAGRH